MQRLEFGAASVLRGWRGFVEDLGAGGSASSRCFVWQSSLQGEEERCLVVVDWRWW